MRSAVSTLSFAAGLEAGVVLRFGDAFINEPFIIASTFFVLIFARGHWRFFSGRAGNGIPAFGFGRGFEGGRLRVHIRLTRQFPFGLFPVGL